MRRSLVVTFAAIILRGPRFKPRPGQKFDEISASCTPHAPPLGPEPVPSLETHHQQVKGPSNGCRYIGRKEETRMKSNGRWWVNGKTPSYGAPLVASKQTAQGGFLSQNILPPWSQKLIVIYSIRSRREQTTCSHICYSQKENQIFPQTQNTRICATMQGHTQFYPTSSIWRFIL